MKKGQRRKENNKRNKSPKSNPHKKRRRNPAFRDFKPADIGLGLFSDMPALVSSVGNAAVLAAVSGCSIQEKTVIGAIITTILKPMLRRVGKESVAATADRIMNDGMSAADCVCKGECLCHTGLQIAGVPCPPECSNYGKVLDGCHRCDCKGEKVQ